MAMVRNGIPNGKVSECHKFVCSVGDTNHNKFWNVWLYDSDDVEIEFGRIGVTSTKGVHENVGQYFMEKKIREKLLGKVNKKTGQREPYKEIQVLGTQHSDISKTSHVSVSNVNLKKIATKQIKHTSVETSKLIEWLVDVNIHQIQDSTGGQVTWNADSGLFQTPLGIITVDAIREAREILIKIGDYVDEYDFDNKNFKKYVDDYLCIVPHNLGMRWSPETFLPDLAAVQKENGILDALDASYVAATSVNDTKDSGKSKKVKSKIFEAKLIKINDSKVIERIEKKYRGSKNRYHTQVSNFRIKQIWEVDIITMAKIFDTIAKRIGNIQELWHGTQASNLLSILKGGLIIPPSSSSHVTGRMFGNGIYGSDQSTKALNYTTSFWGGRDIGRYFMFLVDFAMGKMYTPSGYSMATIPKGYNSTFAKAHSSGVRNNEMVVYKTTQVNLKYLVEFRR